MGCVLGPLLSNFYMGDLEKRLFEKYPDLKPKIYLRYMDDTFGTFNSLEELQQLKNKFQEMSSLKFTFEIEKDAILNFLDVKIKRTD